MRQATKRRSHVCAIIPAYNEEKTIGSVLRVLKASTSLHQVIVVSDGSTDGTAQVAREAGAVVYELRQQGGKGEALLYGLGHTDATIVAFFDADLLGLTVEHIEQLVRPVLNGTRVMNSALRDRGRLLTALTRHLPLIAGERALHRDVIEGVPPEFLKGFMVEVALNYYCRAHGLPYGVVKLEGLSLRRKYQKVGYPRAVLQYGKMFYQVAKAMVVVRIAHWKGAF